MKIVSPPYSSLSFITMSLQGRKQLATGFILSSRFHGKGKLVLGDEPRASFVCIKGRCWCLETIVIVLDDDDAAPGFWCGDSPSMAG
ncbi:hypothetical protein F3Y22_tig00110551pilonHSYRG00240 [Hibiscus syriacus]|uniref:Uncharacterized protein n=1 Tax=Hibiscus syriacus TaxID=106335 RepID=A0A6A3ADJ9_HIBSY|nr:hypothetical protein F3Y22_tig00110551pilonHSYRG00240 [Hibiscus syriacus]